MTLQRVVNLVRPGGPGWGSFPTEGVGEATWNVPRSLLQAFLGCLAVYGALLGMGSVLFGHGVSGMAFGALTGLSIQGILILQRRAA